MQIVSKITQRTSAGAEEILVSVSEVALAIDEAAGDVDSQHKIILRVEELGSKIKGSSK